MKHLKYVFYFTIFFLIFYLEGMPSSNTLSIRQIWKFPIILYLLYHLIVINTCKMEAFNKTNLYYSLLKIINPQYFVNLLFCISEFTKQILVALLYSYFDFIFKENINRAELLLFRFAQFISLSSIPLLLGIIEPMKEYHSLASFDVEGFYYSGIFGSTHAASYIFASSAFILVWGIKNKRIISKWGIIYNSTLILISLYSAYLGFIRTTWLICFIGTIYLLLPKQINIRTIRKIAILLLLFTSAFIYIYYTNSAFNARITGRNVYQNPNAKSIDTEGSGRTLFWKNGIQLWSEGDIIHLLIGNSYEAVTQRNYETTGMRVFSHSQYVDSLAQNGLIGLTLLLLFYYQLFQHCKKYRKAIYYDLAMTLTISQAVFSIFQASFPILIALNYSLTLVCLKYKRVKKTVYNA